ncbi:MFS transporter [Leisingera sp. SS27]|uniref:MFS transporter n=1 Tax=Leisingera sp. SS27 TaxID=2979462 RepID=UPI00232EFE0E|nr:MFS transporter [Leisingera sp. SS27]MDC0659358.1 MFS transporter [Leisingera sp. SS27]
MFAVLWLVGWTLRVPVLAAPPLATRIGNAYGLDTAGIGALTMLPVVAIAFGAIPAAVIITRFGLKTAITGGLLLMAAASSARGYAPSGAVLFSVSVLMGLGVAVFQTALPAATRVWTPSHIALGSAVYLNGMMVGEMSGAGLTLPVVLPMGGDDWRAALLLWSVPIVFIALATVFVRPPEAVRDPTEGAAGQEIAATSMPRWNDPHAWRYGMLLAGSVAAFYVINSYVGPILQDRGETSALAGLLFAYNATPLLASIAVLAVPRWIGRQRPIAASAVLSVAGLAGFAFLSGWPSWAAALLTGFAASVEMILLVSLPAVIAKGHAVTRLSAGMTLVGYGIAFVLPLMGGWLAKRLEWLEFALIPSLVFMVAALFVAGKNRRYREYE